MLRVINILPVTDSKLNNRSRVCEWTDELMTRWDCCHLRGYANIILQTLIISSTFINNLVETL